jgi:MarR family transcriptional regulator, negative regulator of the multidrug operon emrRAB
MNEKKRLSHSETTTLVDLAHHRVVGATLSDVSVNILIRQNFQLLIELLNSELLPHGLNHVAYFAMMMLHANPEQLANPSELGAAIGETRANMTRICDDLVAKGWMNREPSSLDRRRIDLSLTQAGVDILRTVVPGLHARQQKVLGQFSRAEKDTLTALLIKLNQALEADL